MNNRTIRVKFVVGRVAMDGFVSEHFILPLSVTFPPVLDVRLSTNQGIVSGPISGTVHQRQS